MTEKSGDRFLLSGVSRHDLEFALGFVGISDYKIESIEEPAQLGVAIILELKEFAEQSGANPQLVTRLESRLSRFHPETLTEGGSVNLDLLAERLENADRWFAGGKKTVAFAQDFIDSKRQISAAE